MTTATGSSYTREYTEESGDRVAFPLGGIGAGMLCMEGTGALSHFSLRGTADLTNEPIVFSAVSLKRHNGTRIARLLEGAVPSWKISGTHGKNEGWGCGLSGKHYGLPRFSSSSFRARFPFGTVELADEAVPLRVSVTGWSPFLPLRPDDSSLPIAALEYTFTNDTEETLELVYSFHAAHFMATGDGQHRVLPTVGGFIMEQPASKEKLWEQGAFAATLEDAGVKRQLAWFRGGWFDSLTMVWRTIEAGEAPQTAPLTEGRPSPGASLYLPFRLEAGESRTLRLRLAWHVPHTNLRVGHPAAHDAAEPSDAGRFHRPWYSGVYADIDAVLSDWTRRYDTLRQQTERFTNAFYEVTLPSELVEAVSANFSILKSPTLLREIDGRLWGWEGCFDQGGSCHGSCTHVWNYAQAIPHLFPELERTLRQTEFREGQDERGHQNFRVPLPIGPNPEHLFHAAADGQLGGIMKTYREWRISGDTHWLQSLWPAVERSLNYCIVTWDPERRGILTEPHHNTYDIEFWGPDGMCGSIYLGALKAAQLIATALGISDVPYKSLYEKGRSYLENELFNGDYFIQEIRWEGLRATSPLTTPTISGYDSPEAKELLKKEGPKYQYGKGCLSDGVIGAWLAVMCGLGEILDPEKVKRHLLSVYHFNLKHDLSGHANPQRPGYALGSEGGLLLCTWPKGGELSLPFVYSNEVWTGIEYQVASHLMAVGCVQEGLDIVRTCRSRYDGRVRNPFDEYECGHWYARAMASYGLLQGYTGIRYDAVSRILYVEPSIPGDFRSFLCTADGYGNAGVRAGQPYFEPVEGAVRIDRIVYRPKEEREDS